jgi:hypothetical protein
MMAAIVDEALIGDKAPYGLIIAAACNVSAATMAIFRQRALERGVTESHVWTKAQLEDMLFLPENDHLLFAYFGVSLGIRRKSQLQSIRSLITIKRKLIRATASESPRGAKRKELLVRDASDEVYPYHEEVAGFGGIEFPPWHLVSSEWFHPKAILVCLCWYTGWIKEDGTWDIIEESRWAPSNSAPLHIRNITPRNNTSDLERFLPEQGRATIRLVRGIPYENIMEVDPDGDGWYACPHLFCRFDGESGPYRGPILYMARKFSGGHSDMQLDKGLRRPLFRSLRRRSRTPAT